MSKTTTHIQTIKLPQSKEGRITVVNITELSAPEYLDTAAGVHVDSTKLRIFSWSL